MSELSFEKVQCSECRFEFDEPGKQEENRRRPCPKCGSTARSFQEKIGEGLQTYNGYKAKGVHVGKSWNKWFIQISSHYEPQRSRNNAIANVERTIDRDSNRYTEKVTECESGKVLHYTDEPLTDHKGHGSDKPQNK